MFPGTYLENFIKIRSVTAEILLTLSFCGGWWVGRVEKTREQREHARGTPRDLPRNTKAPKQRISSPFIAGGKKKDTDTINKYDRNNAN